MSNVLGNMSGDQKSKHEISITYMMMCIVTVFLISQFPHYFSATLWLTEIIKPKIGAFVPVFFLTASIFGTLNSTLNTVIYCIFNKKFRKVLFQWFPLKGLPQVNNLDDTYPTRPRKLLILFDL